MSLAPKGMRFSDQWNLGQPMRGQWRAMRRILGGMVLALALAACAPRGCSKKKDIPPEDQLHSYISRAVDVTLPEQRQELIDLTTGPLKAALVNASEETFKRAYIDKKYDFKSFDVLQRKDIDGDKEVHLDFKLVYKSWNAGETAERAPVVETTNRAILYYENGQWAIARIESLGSSFEWDVGIPLEDVDATGVSPEDPPKEIESSREGDVEEPGSESAPAPASDQTTQPSVP